MKDTREERILSLGGLVQGEVTRFATKYGFMGFEREDLVSMGWLGAIDAVDRYQPDSKATLYTYARLRVRGNLIDEARKAHGRDGPSKIPIPHSPIYTDSIETIDGRRSNTMFDYEQEREDPGYLNVENKEYEQWLTVAISSLRLSPRNLDITIRVIKGEPHEDIAAFHGITSSRVSMIKNESGARLLKKLAQEGSREDFGISPGPVLKRPRRARRPKKPDSHDEA